MPRDWALNAAICTATCLIRKSLDLGWSHPQDHFTFRAAALCADSAQVPCLCKLGQCVPYMEIHPWIFPDFSRFFKVLEIAPTRKALLRFSSEKRSYPQNLWTLVRRAKIWLYSHASFNLVYWIASSFLDGIQLFLLSNSWQVTIWLIMQLWELITSAFTWLTCKMWCAIQFLAKIASQLRVIT